jgi:hypothetical protein
MAHRRSAGRASEGQRGHNFIGLRPVDQNMSQVGEYRQKAAECQQQAKLSITPLDRQHWLRLAENWLKMAATVGDEIDD